MLLKRAYVRTKTEEVNKGRRDFIRTSALATLALSLPIAGCWNSTSSKPKIVIIGAGIAGLATAYQLKKAGIESTVYEATGRAGGRVLTVENAVVEGAYVDFGAEFIYSIHHDLLALAKELKVDLHDLQTDTLTSKAYFFEGKRMIEEDIVEALQPFAERIAKDVDSIPEDLHYNDAESFQHLDEQSISEYLKGIGMDGWLLRFFELAMEGEYAMESSEQSALNLLIMLSTPVAYDEHYHLFGNYHEVYKFKGGSQKFIDALEAQVKDCVNTGWTLKELNKVENQFELTLKTSEKLQVVKADYVVLAIPFKVIPNVKMNFNFPGRKQQWINEAGFGNAVKMAMGFKKRVWREQGFQGYTFSDQSETVFWDSSQLVNVEGGSLSFAGGGNSAEQFASLSYAEIKTKWLAGADFIFPGLSAAYNGKISKFVWSVHPFAKGSYTSYKTGQWSKFAGVEAEPFGNILFAGEHCSIKHQGFMNGAAETGRKAAEEIVRRLSVNS